MSATVDKSGEKVRRMFGEIAPAYDRMNHLLSMNVDRYWRRRTVQIVRPEGDLPILDCCSGTGDLAFEWERASRHSVPVIAADFCPEMLAVGESKRVRRPKSRVRFLQADTQQLPFGEGQFQIVSAAFGLRNVADTDLALREMTRVCASGGTVAILEFSTPRRQPVKALYGWYFRNVLPRLGQWLARNSSAAYEYLPNSVGDFPAYGELTRKMSDAGLRATRFVPLTFGIATLYLGTR